jgi:hypothetical protein
MWVLKSALFPRFIQLLVPLPPLHTMAQSKCGVTQIMEVQTHPLAVAIPRFIQIHTWNGYNTFFVGFYLKVSEFIIKITAVIYNSNVSEFILQITRVLYISNVSEFILQITPVLYISKVSEFILQITRVFL